LLKAMPLITSDKFQSALDLTSESQARLSFFAVMLAVNRLAFGVERFIDTPMKAECACGWPLWSQHTSSRMLWRVLPRPSNSPDG
jgi:hypothetical protein